MIIIIIHYYLNDATVAARKQGEQPVIKYFPTTSLTFPGDACQSIYKNYTLNKECNNYFGLTYFSLVCL